MSYIYFLYVYWGCNNSPNTEFSPRFFYFVFYFLWGLDPTKHRRSILCTVHEHLTTQNIYNLYYPWMWCTEATTDRPLMLIQIQCCFLNVNPMQRERGQILGYCIEFGGFGGMTHVCVYASSFRTATQVNDRRCVMLRCIFGNSYRTDTP